MEEKKSVSYKGYGDVVLNNESDIAYYKQSQIYEITNALLLGNFNDSGEYVISEDICKELVAIDKLIDETAIDKYFLSAKVGEFKLKLIVETQKTDDNKRNAKLILIEECSIQGILTKKYESLIATFIDDDDINFLFRMKKAFNMHARIEAEGKDMENLDKGAKIIILKNKLKSQKKLIAENRGALDKLYVKAVIEALKGSGEQGRTLLMRFLETIKAKGLNKLNAQKKYIAYREVLDQMLVVTLIEGNFPGKKLQEIRHARKVLEMKAEEARKLAEAEKNKPEPKKAKASGGAAKKKKAEAKKKAKAPAKKAVKKSTVELGQLEVNIAVNKDDEPQKAKPKEESKEKKKKYEDLMDLSDLKIGRKKTKEKSVGKEFDLVM